MAEHSRSYFTRNVTILGLVFGVLIAADQILSSVALTFTLYGEYANAPITGYKYLLFHQLGIETTGPYVGTGKMRTFYLPEGTVISATICAAIGYVCLWLSSRLDSPEKGDTLWESPYIFGGLWASGISFVFVAIMNWRNNLVGDGIHDVLGFFLALPLLAVAVPGTAVLFLYVGLSLGIFLAGIVCIPRIIYVMTRTQKLQRAWQKGKDKVTFHAPDVAEALGVPAESVTVARKLRKDAAALKAEVQAAAEDVRRQEAELAKSMTDDAERFRLEAETSKLMAEIEEGKIRIEELERWKRENPYAR